MPTLRLIHYCLATEGRKEGTKRFCGSCEFLVELRRPALRATHQNPSRCRVAYATETLRLRFGLKVVAIGFQIRLDWTNYWCADLRRPQAQRFPLRVSATRRDTKATRNFTKTQHCSSPRPMRPTFSRYRYFAKIEQSCVFVAFREISVSRGLAENRRLK